MSNNNNVTLTELDIDSVGNPFYSLENNQILVQSMTLQESDSNFLIGITKTMFRLSSSSVINCGSLLIYNNSGSKPFLFFSGNKSQIYM